jgi:hypothetical protein
MAEKIELPKDTFEKVVKIIWNAYALMKEQEVDFNEPPERTDLRNHIMAFIPETTAMYIIDTLGFKRV